MWFYQWLYMRKHHISEWVTSFTYFWLSSVFPLNKQEKNIKSNATIKIKIL